MWPFSRKRKEDRTVVDNLPILTDVAAKMAQTQMEFAMKLGELNLGRLGYRRRATTTNGATRKKNGQFGRRSPAQLADCPLCLDPLYTRPTIPMIEEHRRHERPVAQEQQPADTELSNRN